MWSILVLSLMLTGCLSEEQIRRNQEEANRPIDPAAAMLFLQMMQNQPPVQRYHPMPVPNLVQPNLKANCQAVQNGGLTTMNCW